MRTCVYMYNPESGMHSMKEKVPFIKSRLETAFDTVETYETQSAADTVRAAREYGERCDAVIFSGGDGTFNDVLNGIAPLSKKPILGYLPSGTANDIARNLGIPKKTRKALDVIVRGATIHHDAGCVNGRYFMYVLAAGNFSDVSYRTKRAAKKVLGRVAYGLDSLKTFQSPQQVQGEFKTKEGSSYFLSPLVLIMNSRSVGGLEFNRSGHHNDGKFEIILVRNGQNKGILNLARYFIAGLLNFHIDRVITYTESADFSIVTDPQTAWCVDGDDGIYGDIHVVALPKFVEIYVPMKKGRRS